MMLGFDQVLSELVAVCETFPGFDGIADAAAVRDPHGRVRLALRRRKSGPDVSLAAPLAIDALERALQETLGAWFEAPIVGRDTAASQKLAAAVIERASVWNEAAYETEPGTRKAPPRGRWKLLERRLGKLSWLEGTASGPPWSLDERRPAICTFYSFKGGVGRSTGLVACALLAAREGRRVAVIDLDLEAPGLGALLGLAPGRGVLDFLVDHVATGTRDVTDAVQVPASLGDVYGDRLEAIPAGALSPAYLEKLARLDYLGSPASRRGHEPGATRARGAPPRGRSRREARLHLPRRAGGIARPCGTVSAWVVASRRALRPRQRAMAIRASTWCSTCWFDAAAAEARSPAPSTSAVARSRCCGQASSRCSRPIPRAPPGRRSPARVSSCARSSCVSGCCARPSTIASISPSSTSAPSGRRGTFHRARTWALRRSRHSNPVPVGPAFSATVNRRSEPHYGAARRAER